jgi:hypothetical protein
MFHTYDTRRLSSISVGYSVAAEAGAIGERRSLGCVTIFSLKREGCR